MNPWLTGFLLIIAGTFILAAGLGVVRFTSFYNRVHAATKASTLGVGSALLAAALFFGTAACLFKALLSIFFLFLTLPISAQLLARSQWSPEDDTAASPRREGQSSDMTR
jgi:monovalent cation/proton antiporter MnhG/PhaG subunit